MADFGWRVRRGSKAKRFSHGLVLQTGSRGLLHLSAFREVSRTVLPGSFGLLGPLAAACTSEGIRRDTGIISWLHWPNLVTIDGRVVAKTAISSAAHSRSGTGLRVVFEISVNCFSSANPGFTRGLPATSILEALGVEIQVDLLRDKILHALDWYSAEWERGMDRKLLDRIQPTVAWLGSYVVVRTSGATALRGKARGLDEQGSLVLEQPDAGRGPKTVTLRPENVDYVRFAP